MKNEKHNNDSLLKKSGFKTGYSRKNNRNINPNSNNTKNAYDYSNISTRYPTGIIPFVCLMVLWVIGVAVSIGVGCSWDSKHPGQQGYVPQQWYNILWYISAAIECLVGLWALGRAGFLSHARYGLMKLGRVTKISKLRTKIKAKLKQELAIDEVTNLDEWNEFLELRKRYTKKWWTISWATFTGIFGATTVLMLILGGINGAFNV